MPAFWLNLTRGRLWPHCSLSATHCPHSTLPCPQSTCLLSQVSTAYAVLSDPNKKRQYDLHGEGEGMGELSTINVEDLGTVGRWVGRGIEIVTKTQHFTGFSVP